MEAAEIGVEDLDGGRDWVGMDVDVEKVGEEKEVDGTDLVGKEVVVGMVAVKVEVVIEVEVVVCQCCQQKAYSEDVMVIQE